MRKCSQKFFVSNVNQKRMFRIEMIGSTLTLSYLYYCLDGIGNFSAYFYERINFKNYWKEIILIINFFLGTFISKAFNLNGFNFDSLMDEMKWNKMKDNYANFYYISDSGANWFQWLNSRQDFVEFHFCFSNDSNIFLF